MITAKELVSAAFILAGVYALCLMLAYGLGWTAITFNLLER
jgi:hypothetical protein